MFNENFGGEFKFDIILKVTKRERGEKGDTIISNMHIFQDNADYK